jgi:hypothetical protein
MGDVASAVAALRAAAATGGPAEQEASLAALHAALCAGDAAGAASAVAAGALTSAVLALRDANATPGARSAACGCLAAALQRLQAASPGLAAADRQLQRDLGAAVAAVAAALRSRGDQEAALEPAACAALRWLLAAHPPNAALAVREGAAPAVRAAAERHPEAAGDAAAVLAALDAAERAADEAAAAAAAAFAAARCGEAGACPPECGCAVRSVRGLLGTRAAPNYLATLRARAAQPDADAGQ